MSSPTFRALPKQPDMVVPVGVDFGPAMREGETFSGGGVAVTVHDYESGVETTTEMALPETITVVDNVVEIDIKGGTDGHDYVVHFKVTTNYTARVEDADAILPVRLRPDDLPPEPPPP